MSGVEEWGGGGGGGMKCITNEFFLESFPNDHHSSVCKELFAQFVRCFTRLILAASIRPITKHSNALLLRPVRSRDFYGHIIEKNL